MNFDIASELSGLFDFSKTIPSLTISFIAASGILLLCACILVTFTARRIVGLRFMPVLYGATSYLLFYIMIGSFLSGLLSLTIPHGAGTATLAVARFMVLLITSSLIVCGRFFAMWFIRKYYAEYCDAYGIGVGVALTEAIITAVTIFLNYSLCLTLNSSGLAALANGYDTIEEATRQLNDVWFLYSSPSYVYLFSGAESIMFLIFNTMISVMFYAVCHKELKRLHLVSIIGLQTLMYLPANLYSSGIIFNRIGCFITEIIIFAGCVFLFNRIHNKYYKNIKPPVKEQNSSDKKGYKSSTGSRMPDFNKNINK